MSQPSSTGHRAEIDFLRAVAILGVLLYHLQIRPVSGGFVGVDVFLVISGFLITQVLDRPGREPVALADFYIRRIYRLYPALVATVLASLLASYFLFLPGEFWQLSRSGVFAVLGLSNVLSWAETGYFDVASHGKPLLHMWSLGLELQFYLLWPFVVRLDIAMRRRLPAGTLPILLALASFGVSLVLGADEPASFYLLPPRLWEFCIGAILAIRCRDSVPRHGTVLASLGISIILGSMLLYSPRTPFPGWFALPPVLGAGLCLYAGGQHRLARLYSSNSVQTIGRLSYTLYLVHWPLIVFATLILHGTLNTLSKVVLLSLSFGLSFLLHTYIERPLLRRPARLEGQVVTGRVRFGSAGTRLAAATGVTILASTAVWVTNGLGAFRVRGMSETRSVVAYDYERAKTYVWSRVDRFESAGGFTTSKRKLLLIGDSQAADLLNVLVEAGFERSTEIIMLRVNSVCGLPYLPPKVDASTWWDSLPETARAPKLREKCQQAMERITRSPARQQADQIVVAFHWRPFAFDHAADSVRAIAGERQSRIWVAGSKTLGSTVPETLTRSGDLTHLATRAAELIPAETKEINERLERAFPTHFIDLLGSLCQPGAGCTLLDETRTSIFSDTLHFTPEGARFMSRHAAQPLKPLDTAFESSRREEPRLQN